MVSAWLSYEFILLILRGMILVMGITRNDTLTREANLFFNSSILWINKI